MFSKKNTRVTDDVYDSGRMHYNDQLKTYICQLYIKIS